MTRPTRRYHLVVWLVVGPLALVVLALSVLSARERHAALAPAAVGGRR